MIYKIIIIISFILLPVPIALAIFYKLKDKAKKGEVEEPVIEQTLIEQEA